MSRSCWASYTLRFKICRHWNEFFIKESSSDSHWVHIQWNCLASLKVAFTVQCFNKLFGWNDEGCLVNFVSPFESSLQISFRIIVVRIDTWNEIEFSRLNVIFNRFFIIKASRSFVLIFWYVFPYLRTISIKQSFGLSMRVKSEFWSNLFLSGSLSHSPVHVFGLSWNIINSWVVFNSFLQSFLVSSNSSKVHDSGTFARSCFVCTLL